jgi:hypothetical protein
LWPLRKARTKKELLAIDPVTLLPIDLTATIAALKAAE